jgi:hypothetical protein
MISPRRTAHSLAALGASCLGLLYRFSPQEYSFYPRCPFYALTNHYCPGCGATRAIAELLHLHFAAALHFNAAVFLLLPVLFWYLGRMYGTAVRENRVEWPQVPGWSWHAAVAAILLFAVVRDLAQTVS